MKLFTLHQDIDARVATIRQQHPDWPCAKGCGHCCQQLADVPQLTSSEWQLLRAGLLQLSESQRQHIATAVATLGPHPTGPVVCPLLDHATQACPVYAYRPVACRTYGFYSERVLGLYCGDIERAVDSGRYADVIWGNHEAIERQLDRDGPRRALTEWLADEPQLLNPQRS